MSKNQIDSLNSKFEFHSGHPSMQCSKYQSSYICKTYGQTVGIVCLNSAWRCYDSETDRNSLIIGEIQLQNGIKFTDGSSLRVALVHHPVDWLAEFDQNAIQPLLQKHFQLVFCGHIHKNSSWQQAGLYGNIFVSIAPPNWITAARELNLADCNGYSIIDIDPSSLVVTVTHRRFSATKKTYVANNDLGDNEGRIEVQLPTTTETKKRHDEYSVASVIKKTRFDELNEHLLTYNSDSHAPQDLRSLFVLPAIVKRDEVDTEKEKKQKPLSLVDVCSTDGHLILLGVKESGRTTLLDRLLIEFTDNIDKYARIPIIVDFVELGNRRLETMVGRFLGVGLSAGETLLREHKSLLLIDNLRFDKNFETPLQRLAKFLKDYPQCRMVATVEQSLGRIVPLELLENLDFAGIQRVFIKPFGTKEIRDLMQKWFISGGDFSKPQKVDHLVNLILSFNLPRTPLAVSMFLWILEQQQNYQPINQASMLENFVEKLLLKHSRKEIYSDQFGFRNMERILAEIAHQMLSVGAENYRLRYRELIDFVDDYLRSRKFDLVTAQDLVDHFIDKGVLIREFDDSDIYVRFRFGCFFQYFLMKKMEFDDSFREHVLKEENFLYFEDEIDYYTGIKRDQIVILKSLLDRMSSGYREVLSAIGNLPESFDFVFDKDGSIVKSLDESFVSKLSEAKKPSQTEIDAMKDEALDKIPLEKEIQRKPKQLSGRARMERLWTLTARVLKNTEETGEKDLKYNSFLSVLHCSLAHAVLWKVNVEKFVAEQKKKDPYFQEDVELAFQRKVLPLIHQMVVSYFLGTKKLRVVLREKIEEDMKNLALSDFERFVTPFVYADLEAPNFEVYLKNLIKRMSQGHLLDMVLLKLATYYFLRSTSPESDRMYENLIGDVIIRAKGLPRDRKANIIQEYRSKKQVEIARKGVRPTRKKKH